MHYWLQRNVTNTLPTGASKFREIFQAASQHLHSLEPFKWRDRKPAIFYEFGAGWDLAIPLSFYSLGVDCQILVDIRKLLKIELANATIRMLNDIAKELALPRIPTRLFSMNDGGKWVSQLEDWYGIRYLAPCDARHTNLPSESVDFITSTNTLEHVPGADVALIMSECRRIVKPDGAISFIIDYQDHYSYFDRTISAYNFLKYSPLKWKAFNPDLHFQNRLRHRDYGEIARLSGLMGEVVTSTGATSEDVATVEELAAHASFAERYTPQELAVRGAQFVLRKSRVQPCRPERSEFAVSESD